MALKQVLDVYEVMDSANVDGAAIADLLRSGGVDDVEVERIHGQTGFTDCLKVVIPVHRGSRTADPRRRWASSGGSVVSAPDRSASASSPTATALWRRWRQPSSSAA